MTVSQAVIFGVVQGITEFFPVSSSGHLALFQALFGLKGPQVDFDIFLHVGTLVSILIFFRKSIWSLFGKDRKTLFLLITASIPTFVIGFSFKDAVERFFLNPTVVGYMLIVTGIWLTLAAISVRKGAAVKEPGILNSLAIGVAQGIAVMPGISRSGATVATGLMAGMEREAAFRFSFLLSIPAVAGATLVKACKIGHGIFGKDAVSYVSGGLVAALVGLWAIKVFLGIVKGNRLHIFGIYCILAGLAAVIFFRG